ncbi:MAG: hypothetical protein ABMA15_24420, partial [Vicinamibacterales bacterium]
NRYITADQVWRREHEPARRTPVTGPRLNPPMGVGRLNGPHVQAISSQWVRDLRVQVGYSKLAARN